ncbi:MAG: DNA mismatch repair protein MutS, partial [Pseudolabrys sp.]|nr:DNA mismatch repair protein MutS [Pseudolabrys sp.]
MALAQPSGMNEPETPAATGADDMRVTPAMAQYVEIKAANPDCLLFYRMGDFYEMFFDDAETASRALGIMLTKRGKYLGKDVPLCGVPVVRADEYLHKLIALGHRVAVCEQLEDPAEAKKRGSKSVVRRDVVRLVTPGTLTEDTLLDAGCNNFLLAVARARASDDDSRFGLAWIDISTGEFRIAECDRAGLSAEIARLEPSEIIVSDALYSDAALVPLWRELPAVTPLPRDVFDSASAERRLSDFFAIATSESFGTLSRLELAAAAACVTYVERTQLGQRPPLSPPLRESTSAAMAIDQATRANLELMRTLGGDRKGSLLAAIDRTVTSGGSRLLAQRLAAPLTDMAAIARRHDAVSALVKDAALRAELRDRLNKAPDLARALARLAVGRGGPRDLAAIRDGLLAAGEMSRRLSGDWPAEITEAAAACKAPDAMLAAELSAALAAELPAFKRDGGFVRASYDSGLDELRALRDESRRVVAALQARYADDTGIKTLKIRHNNVLGYFVEVTEQHSDKLMKPPFNATFIHRQTLASQMRFTSTELGELEAKIASAGDRALGIELEIFDKLTAQVMAQSAPIKRAAEALAVLDVTAALATLAAEREYVRPQVDQSLAF